MLRLRECAVAQGGWILRCRDGLSSLLIKQALSFAQRSQYSLPLVMGEDTRLVTRLVRIASEITNCRGIGLRMGGGPMLVGPLKEFPHPTFKNSHAGAGHGQVKEAPSISVFGNPA